MPGADRASGSSPAREAVGYRERPSTISTTISILRFAVVFRSGSTETWQRSRSAPGSNRVNSFNASNSFRRKNARTVGGLWVEQVGDDARQAQFVRFEVIEHVEPARG